MKVLITGGSGFIGSNLVRACLASGHVVLNLDALTYAGNSFSLADVEQSNRYHFLKADITNSDKVMAAIKDFQPNSVMHLAAESHVDRSIDGPSQFIQTNIVGTFNLLQASFQHWKSLSETAAEQFRFLHVSTDEVYGSLGSEGLFSETTPYDPHSPYSASKASSDHLVRSWHSTYGLPTLITNCSNNYGPYQFPEKLIPVVILKCLRNEPIPVYGKGTNVRDWLYVDDHCSALTTVVDRGKIGETYNIGGNNEKTNLELVHLICEILDEFKTLPEGRKYEQQISFVADRPGHDLRYAIDATKIKRELNWSAKQDHTSGFRRTVQWYLENESWWQSIVSGEYQMERQGISPADSPASHG